METRFLETFLLVVQQGSLAEAARRLGITPAAVAQRMQVLEDEVGQPLLIRAGRKVRPTETGYAILEQSRRVLAEVRHLRGLARTDAPAGELRLGAISTALTGLLPPALRRIHDTMPSVEVFLLPGTSTDLYRHLIDATIDAAILVKPPFPIPKALDWRLLRSEPLVLLCHRELAGEAPQDLLCTRPFIRYDRNNWGGRLADRYLLKAGLRPQEWLELDSLEAIAVMVGNGLGVSIVPDWARPWPEGLEVATLPLPAPTVAREIGLLWQRSSPGGRLVQVLLAALSNVLPREGLSLAPSECLVVSSSLSVRDVGTQFEIGTDDGQRSGSSDELAGGRHAKAGHPTDDGAGGLCRRPWRHQGCRQQGLPVDMATLPGGAVEELGSGLGGSKQAGIDEDHEGRSVPRHTGEH